MSRRFQLIFLLWILLSTNISGSHSQEYVNNQNNNDYDDFDDDPGLFTCDTMAGQCQFPSQSGSHSVCVNDIEICGSGTACDGQFLDPETDYFCNPQMDSRIQDKPWSKCSSDCFDGEEKKEFQDGQSCSTEIRKCIFPFEVNGKTYDNCTDDSLSGSGAKENFKWCATSTNRDKSMKPGKWGICNVDSCGHISINPEPPGPKPQNGTDGGVIAGIVIGVIGGLGAIGFFVYTFVAKKLCFADHQQVPTDPQI